MQLGFSTMNNAGGLAPQRLASELEARGFGSYWVGEHSHIPVGSPGPGGRAGAMPPSYKAMMDPFVSLAAAAAATTSLRLGTSVALPAERDPFLLAKEVATLDQLSGGRVLLGVGVGWNRVEYENHTDVPWAQRYRLVRERIGVLRCLWGAEESSYAGEYHRFGPVWSYPKPVQQPHPPVLVGAGGALGIRHAVEWGDGWAPLVGSFEDFRARHDTLRRAAETAGRDPATIHVMVTVRGTPEVGALEPFREFGITMLRLGGDPTLDDSASAVLRRIDHYATYVPQLR